MQIELLQGAGPQRDEQGAIADDAFYTPEPCADACVGDLEKRGLLAGVGHAREPSVGDGAFVRALRRRRPRRRFHDRSCA